MKISIFLNCNTYRLTVWQEQNPLYSQPGKSLEINSSCLNVTSENTPHEVADAGITLCWIKESTDKLKSCEWINIAGIKFHRYFINTENGDRILLLGQQTSRKLFLTMLGLAFSLGFFFWFGNHQMIHLCRRWGRGVMLGYYWLKPHNYPFIAFMWWSP